jgi:hypothetical protein
MGTAPCTIYARLARATVASFALHDHTSNRSCFQNPFVNCALHREQWTEYDIVELLWELQPDSRVLLLAKWKRILAAVVVAFVMTLPAEKVQRQELIVQRRANLPRDGPLLRVSITPHAVPQRRRDDSSPVFNRA